MVYLLGVAFVATPLRPAALRARRRARAWPRSTSSSCLPTSRSRSATPSTSSPSRSCCVVSLLISTLAARVRAQAEAARRREQRTRVLYALSRDLAGARTVGGGGAGGVAARRRRSSRARPAVLLPDRDGRLALDSRGARRGRRGRRRWRSGPSTTGQQAGLGTDTLPGRAGDLRPAARRAGGPGRAGRAAGGVAAARWPRSRSTSSRPWPARPLPAWSGCGWPSEAEEARLAAETERLRSTLLSSVSHDLRTPLATITGAASSLLQPGTLGPEAERELKEAIYEEAERLNRLVTNLLDMTRLESGSLQLSRTGSRSKSWWARRWPGSEAGSKGRRVEVRIPADLPLVSVDGLLDRAGPREPARQRRQVHRPGSRDLGRGHGAGEERSRSRWRTKAPAFRRGRRSRSSRSSTGRGGGAAGLRPRACRSARRS